MSAIEELASGLRVGHVGLGMHGTNVGSPKQQVHDGDTITVRAIGNFGMRFLGVDAPEVSFTLPGNTNFTAISDQKWETFLSNPLGPDIPLSANLRQHLQASVGPGTATNHAHHAELAHRALEQEVIDDMAALQKNKEDFRFFLAFATETMDRYGRLLAFINREQATDPRPLSYNERLLQKGLLSPYFIWPNVNPFRKQPSLIDAVIPPNTANDAATADNTLHAARIAVSAARQAEIGLFIKQNPLKLQPFELRFLAQRRAPDRWVIDLSKNNDMLIKPENYFTVQNVEDRLYIPREYVPLFVEAGWKRQP